MRRSMWDFSRLLVLGFAAATLFLLAGRVAHATEPARVHVVLHVRGDAATTVTFVDISVRGTEVPIRLVRRVEGPCTMQGDGAMDAGAALVRVDCTSAPAVHFEVARVRDEIVVRRESEGESDPGVASGAPDAGGVQVIARAVVPAGTQVRVE